MPLKETESGALHTETKTAQGISAHPLAHQEGLSLWWGESTAGWVLCRWVGWLVNYSISRVLQEFKMKGRQKEDVCAAGLLELWFLLPIPRQLCLVQHAPIQHAQK